MIKNIINGLRLNSNHFCFKFWFRCWFSVYCFTLTAQTLQESLLYQVKQQNGIDVTEVKSGIFNIKYEDGLIKTFNINDYLSKSKTNCLSITNIDLNNKLAPNYPNPFNPSTTISYQLPEYSFVKIKIYNSLGTEISELVNEFKQAGQHNVTFNAKNLPSEVYICTVQVYNNGKLEFNENKIL